MPGHGQAYALAAFIVVAIQAASVLCHHNYFNLCIANNINGMCYVY